MRLGRTPGRSCAVAAAVGLLASCDAGPTSRAKPVTASQSSAGFRFVAHKLSPALRRRITGVSWHRGCPAGLARLRYLRIAYHGFDGRIHTGEMIANRSAVRPLRRAFASLYSTSFPIRRMRLVDDYGGSDYASIEADNTSAFNCRRATGQSR